MKKNQKIKADKKWRWIEIN